MAFFSSSTCLYSVDGRGSPLILKARHVDGLLARCTVPTVVTVATSSLCGVTSDVFVKRKMKPLTVSNLTLAFPLVGLTTTFNSLIKIKTSALISIGLKRGSCRKTGGILKGMLILGMILKLTFALIFVLLLSPVLCFFKTDRGAVSCTHSCVGIVLVKGIVARVCLKLGTILHSSNFPGLTVCTALTSIIVGYMLGPLFVFNFN